MAESWESLRYGVLPFSEAGPLFLEIPKSLPTFGRDRKGMTDGSLSSQLNLMIMGAKGGYVYIISNKTRSVLYVGVTSNLHKRVHEHRSGKGSEFTAKYNCYDLVYYKFFDRIETAIEREKKIKKWNRAWKDKLISDFNPSLKDLSKQVSEMN